MRFILAFSMRFLYIRKPASTKKRTAKSNVTFLCFIKNASSWNPEFIQHWPGPHELTSEPEPQLRSVLLLLCILAPLPYPGYVSMTTYMYMYVYEQGIVCYARQEARIPPYQSY